MKFINFPHLEKSHCDKILGHGGFATVRLYTCKDNCSGNSEEVCNKKFVVKQIRNDSLWRCTNNDEKHKRFLQIIQNEYQIGRELDHKNIVRTLAISEGDDAIAFEYFNGMDLLDYINSNNNLLHTEMILFFLHVLDALEYMHSLGIAHMDIKLENIVVDFDNNVLRLIDFGHSYRFKDRETREIIYTSKISGTDAYFPPEYHKIKRYRGDKIDVWCCGILLYQMIYETVPWEHSYYKDSRYTIFEYKQRFDNELDERLFYDRHTDLCEEDWDILLDIFHCSLWINPEGRCDIKTIRDMIYNMRFIKRLHAERSLECEAVERSLECEAIDSKECNESNETERSKECEAIERSKECEAVDSKECGQNRETEQLDRVTQELKQLNIN